MQTVLRIKEEWNDNRESYIERETGQRRRA